MAASASIEDEVEVIYYLRDNEPRMITAWKDAFKYVGNVFKISAGDIFKDAPAADAIVSPANSFGFMVEGIDRVYSRHFGWQLQEGPRHLMRHKHGGELPVGQAIIVRMFEPGVTDVSSLWWYGNPYFNKGQPIQYLISAPTMRIPMDVSNTVNAYLAFRAVIRAVKDHNSIQEDKIRSVLCPGLCTLNGQMPYERSARQMREAWDIFGSGINEAPSSLSEALQQHTRLTK